MSWFALFVKSGEERDVEGFINQHFDKQSLFCYVPKKLVPEKKQGCVHDSAKVIFPGYVFINTSIISTLYHRLRKTPKIYYLVKSGEHKLDQSYSPYSEIPDEEMDMFLQLVGPNDMLGYSDVIVMNKRAKVIAGPLFGKEGIIRKIDKRKGRAKIEVMFLGETRMIEVGINILST
ncbi:antiterminator LoaP [Paenibacillus sp. ACRRX]|uniref:antiterminator LoaP n=1 Tax=Paenibacillus sp. ACRRX TaxID=2918206 RepID=UPI001EF68C9E|nr:antiterminator LoaP [Paenibacillus sp. ACRRX]MCG7407075.1 antiterminator LoaP [Paenibacillus sp. ACRRX]